MGTYRYIARTQAGEQVDGLIDADSEAAVLRALDERQLFPVTVGEHEAAKPMLGGKIRPRHVGVVYGQLADLLQAGVPLLRALDTVARATPNKRLSETVAAVRDDVSAGKSLADSFSEHPRAFKDLHIAMVRAGERAGFLEDVLANLGLFIERQDELRGKVRGAMIYPALISGIGAMIVGSMLIFMVPRFRDLLVNIPKPLPTRLLFGLSEMLQSHLLLLAGMAVLLVAAVRWAVKSPAFLRGWDRWRMRLPIIGSMMRMVSVTRFCRILGTLLANGVPILEALEISKDAIGCSVMAAHMDAARENVRAGERLADPLRGSGLFPAEIVEMIAVAEEANRLEKVLLQVADTVERRTSARVDQAVRLVEPLILLLLAMVILFVAIGLLYPILLMSQSMQR